MATIKYPEVTVIMPVYNTLEYLGAAIDSILGQTLADIELIAVDDGSTDGCADLLKSRASQDPRLQVISQPNRGQGAARNAALKHATGRYIYFMDSDDILASEALEKCVSLCDRDDLDLLLFDADTFGDEGMPGFRYDREGVIEEERIWTGPSLLFEELEKRVFYVSPCLFVIRKDLLDGFGGFPEGSIHEDNVLAMHLMLHASRTEYTSQKYFSRRVRPDSTMTRRFGRRNVDGYVTACTEIRSWRTGSPEHAALVDRFLDCTLDSVVWLSSPMPLRDKVYELRRFVSTGLFRHVSLRNWVRLFLRRGRSAGRGTLALMWRRLSRSEFGKDVVIVPRDLAGVCALHAEIVCGYDDDMEPEVLEHTDGRVSFVRRSLGRNIAGRIPRNIAYLLGHARSISVLMCFHWRPETLLNVLVYKMMHPSGKAFVKLDTVSADEFNLSRCSAVGRLLRRAVYLPMLSLVDVISCETSSAMKTLQKYASDFPSLAGKTVLLPDPVDEEGLRPSDPLPAKEDMFLVVGRLGTRQKNTEMVMEAIEGLDLGGWTVCLAGPASEPFAGRLREFCASHPGVEYVGEISDREALRSLYGRARVFVLPSRWESYGIVLAEAARFGCFILSTDVGAAGDIVKERNGIMIPQEDASALRKVMGNVINGNIDTGSTDGGAGMKDSYEDSISCISRLLGF